MLLKTYNYFKVIATKVAYCPKQDKEASFIKRLC